MSDIDVQYMSKRESMYSSEALTEIISTGAPVALTAPLRRQDTALIDFYGEFSCYGCTKVPLRDITSSERLRLDTKDARLNVMDKNSVMRVGWKKELFNSDAQKVREQ
jgi:hypothetical protein